MQAAGPRAVGRGAESAVRSKCSSFSLQTLKLPQVKEPHKAVSTHCLLYASPRPRDKR